MNGIGQFLKSFFCSFCLLSLSPNTKTEFVFVCLFVCLNQNECNYLIMKHK